MPALNIFKGKKARTTIVAILSIIGLIASALLISNMMYDNSTPEGAVRSFFDAENAYDAKAAADICIYRFMPTAKYNEKMGLLQAELNYYEQVGAHFTLSIISVDFQNQMQSVGKELAHRIIDGLSYHGINATVDDFALVRYDASSVNLPGSQVHFHSSFLFKINARWYMVPTDFYP